MMDYDLMDFSLKNTPMESQKSQVKDVLSFINAAKAYQLQYPKEKSKLVLCLIKQTQKYEPKVKSIIDDLNIDRNALRHRAASVDDHGNLIEKTIDFKTGDKGNESTSLRYAYKPEKIVSLDKEIAKLEKDVEEKEMEITPPYKSEPFFVEIPEKFDFRYLEVFKKFIFNPEISEEDEFKAFMSQDKKEEKLSVKSVLN
jgi:hypothetical protein